MTILCKNCILWPIIVLVFILIIYNLYVLRIVTFLTFSVPIRDPRILQGAMCH